MISTVLAGNSHLVAPALLLVIAACVVVGVLAALRGGRLPLATASGASLVLALAFTLAPGRTRAASICAVQFSVPDPGRVELVANIALFVPLIYFLTLLTRRPVVAALAGMVLSALIEIAQAAVPSLGRSCDTNDWVMNTLGAAIGAVIGEIVLAALRVRGARRSVSSRTTSAPRSALR